MAIVRYDGRPNGDGTETIQFDVPEGEFAKIIGHTGVGYNLYHNNTEHEHVFAASEIDTGAGLTTWTVPAASGIFTGEVAALTVVQIIDQGGGAGSFSLNIGTGAFEVAHTTGTNVFTPGSSVRAFTASGGYTAEITWVTHDGNFQVTTAAGVYQTTLGLNDGDHIEIAEAASGAPINSLTVETGITYRPGNK